MSTKSEKLQFIINTLNKNVNKSVQIEVLNIIAGDDDCDSYVDVVHSDTIVNFGSIHDENIINKIYNYLFNI
jgi:hypothetical protein